MATREDNNESREILEQVIAGKYLPLLGKTTAQAAAQTLAKLEQRDGTVLEIASENHHGHPAIILYANEEKGGVAVSILNSLKNNNYALTEAMREDSKGKYYDNIAVTNASNIMNLALNKGFSKKMIDKLFTSFLAGLTGIGHDSLSQDIQEIMEAQYDTTLRPAL